MVVDLSEIDGFEWDKGNRQKIERRVGVPAAEAAFLGEPLVGFDQGHSQSEQRYFLMNQAGERYVFLIFTLRGKKVRVVSARYMHQKEVKKYGKKIG